MNNQGTGTGNDQLSALWAEYRGAFPDPDVSKEFMPILWHRIEARRRETASTFCHFARLCMAITAVSIILLYSVSMPPPDNDEYSFARYVDLIAADQVNEDVIQGIPIP